MSSSPNVLAERDPNIPQSPEKNKLKDDNQDGPKSLEYHRQVLESRLKENKLVKTTKPGTMSQPNTSNAASVGSQLSSSLVHQAHAIRSTSRNQQSYVSPSDTIMSPATAKLAAFKNRHVKSVKPRTLFAKTTTNNAEAAVKQAASDDLQKSGDL